MSSDRSAIVCPRACNDRRQANKAHIAVLILGLFEDRLGGEFASVTSLGLIAWDLFSLSEVDVTNRA